MRLASDLQTEREHGKMLEGQLAEVNAKLAAAAAETEQLKEELAEKGRADAQLRQEVRWIDEASAKARAQEEEERKAADQSLHEQIRALSEAQERTVLEADSTARGAAGSLAETSERCSRGWPRQRAARRSRRAARADAESIRSELSQQAASREAEVAEIAEARRRRAEALRRAALGGRGAHALPRRGRGQGGHVDRLAARGGLRQAGGAQGAGVEAIVPPGEPGALSTLRDALSRVDVLGEAVAQLCEYMQSLKVKEVASAAEARISDLEGKLSTQVHPQQLEGRIASLEAALAQEQQSSLRALQAILEAQAGAVGEQ